MSTMTLRLSGSALPPTTIVVLLWGLCSSLASAGTFSVFDKTYVRQTGAPDTVTDTFSVFNPNAPYTLHVQNSGISSALVFVNGVQVLGPSDFNPNVTSIDLFRPNGRSALRRTRLGNKILWRSLP